jgi:hypothetical protein
MLNSADILYDRFGIDEVSLSRHSVIVYDAVSIERTQKFKRGEHSYRIIAYAGKLYEAMVDESLSFKIARFGV